MLASRSRAAASTMALGVTAAAAWALWLRAYLFDDGLTRSGALAVAMPYAAAGIGVLAAVAIVRAGGSLFRMLLAAAFTYLSFQAVRNISLFAMVGGAVLALESGGMFRDVAGHGRIASRHGYPGRSSSRWSRRGPWGRRRTATISRWETTSARPARAVVASAHEAARFAGRPGLPGHAFVFHLGQAGVYVYHNGPDRKVYIDGRLEVPSSSTFRNYVRIQDLLSRNDSRWDVAASRLGDPLILISHDRWTEAEATLLAHPRWRCIHFDEVASIFVPRSGPSSAPSFPEFDFTAVPSAEASALPTCNA